MNLHLIRHTAVAVPSGICYGQSDIDVAASFTAESASLQDKLAHVQLDAIYTSPLQRCSRLAAVLGSVDIHVDERLKELHFGDWEMQAWDAIPRDIFDVWANDYANLSPPNGETFLQLYQRVTHFLEELLSRHHKETIAIVTHGGVIRAILAHVLNMPLKGLFRIVIDYGSVTHISFDQAVPRILFVNR